MVTLNDFPMLLKHLPHDEKPRERFIKYGPSSLSNHELVAILLRTGTKKESVLQISARLLQTFGGLRSVKEASIEEMSKIRGVGKAKAISLLAALELGTRLHHQTTDNRYVIRTPEDGANFVMEDMRFLQQENFVCFNLT